MADFGENALGVYETRGSHFRWISDGENFKAQTLNNSKLDPTKGGTLSQQYDNRTPEMDLDGALIKDMNINGKIKGSGAAIKIARNAHVENINVGNGAEITGDIKSEWESNLEWIYDEVDSYVYNGLYNKNYTRFNKEEDIAAAGLNYTTKLSTAKGVIAKVDGNVTGNKSIDVVNNGELTITGVIDTASFTNNGTLISDGGVLVEDRDGCKFINSGKIVASGRNIINTSDLGKIGGMDITADHNNARLDNAVIRLDGVKTANLKDQEIILHGDGYVLTNTSGNLEILLEDTKINNDVITGRMLNSLKMASSEAVYGDLKGNNGVIAVTGDTTVAQADLVEQPTDPVAEPTNPDDIADQAEDQADQGEDQADQADQDADAQSGKDKKLNRVALAKKSETARMDLYAKYYLSHLAAQDFGLINKTTGEVQQWHIDSIISHVSKVGVAFNFNTSDALRWKVGAAWQRVYGSKAKSFLDYSKQGFIGEVVVPSLRGDSAVIDLGLYYRATDRLDIGLEGTATFGKNKGFLSLSLFHTDNILFYVFSDKIAMVEARN